MSFGANTKVVYDIGKYATCVIEMVSEPHRQAALLLAQIL